MGEATARQVADDFRDPFVGHLPGYLEAAQASGTDRPSEELYSQLLMKRWRLLLDSEASRDESLVQGFVERHPTLLSGAVLCAPRPPSTCHDALHETRRICIADRVDVDVLVNQFINGSVIKDLATEYAISKSSVKRLLRTQHLRRGQ